MFIKEEIDYDKWSRIEEKLGNLFRNTADICFKKGLISQIERDRYFVSVTEKEIYNGILTAKNVSNNALFFIREIEDLENECEKITDKKDLGVLKKFIDMDKNNKIDQSAKNLLDILKYTKIPSKLPESNIFKFRVINNK